MAQVSEKELKHYLNNILNPADTFKFTCAMCGKCCRKRQDPIMMTGVDIFRIAKALDKYPAEVIRKYMRGYIGDTSKLPVFVLDERPDGSCKLLRKGRCTVQENKPIVCAIYPLGRLLQPDDKEFKYFVSQASCANDCPDGQEWTLQEWLDNFGVHEWDAESLAWHSMLLGLTKVTVKMEKSQLSEPLVYVLSNALYTNYSIHKDFITQVEENKEMLQKFFQKMFHKKLSFK